MNALNHLPTENKTASFQNGSYAYPSSIVICLWSKICIEKFPCVWANKTPEHTSQEKTTALKDCDQKEIIGFDCISL